MTRRVFYSFHYQNDNWRVSQVRNIGAIEGSPVAHSNDWEQIKRQGDRAIKNWIDSNLQGRSCLVVLIGAETADRRWVQYEIETAWNKGMGVCGVYIHNLKDVNGNISLKGRNPFDNFVFDLWGLPFNPPILDPEPDILSRLSGGFSYYEIIRNELPTLIEQSIEYQEQNKNWNISKR